jgi:hypothetical protein
MQMTSLERVMAAFRREIPNRVPIFEAMIDPTSSTHPAGGRTPTCSTCSTSTAR